MFSPIPPSRNATGRSRGDRLAGCSPARKTDFMIAPSPYGRPPRDPSFKVDRRRVADTGPRPARPKGADPECPPGALDREVVQIFAWGRYPTFLDAFEGFRPRWAVAAFGRCLDRGLLAEHDVTFLVTVTPAGWEEAGRG